MSSKTAKPVLRSAAWRISLWATLAFTCGTLVVFAFLDRFVASDIQRRSDAWLSGEVEVLGDVVERTPKDALYNRVVGEIAELASREVPNREVSSEPEPSNATNDSVFFLQTAADGAVKLWVGSGNGQAQFQAIRSRTFAADQPDSIRVRGFNISYRVASIGTGDGGRVYLGLSERDERRVLGKLRFRFFVLWLSIVLLGFAIVFYASRRMLSHVRAIADAASRIGQSDLKTRVPTTPRSDEIAQLALTLNTMLDRIENTVHQLHTITDSLAHDLRSPLTAIRGRLEASLAGARPEEQVEAIVAAIEELDRLADFLNKSLDVAEARADALRLTPVEIDLDALLRSMIALYEPSMAEKGIEIHLQSCGQLCIVADEGLMHRMVANLFDNEFKHLQAGSTVTVMLTARHGFAHLDLHDNGRGFDSEVLAHLFSRRVKGRESSGHGLGLAFVDAVVRAHEGSISAANLQGGGAEIAIALPLAPSN
ncbi:MAG: HAMP domain-containing sensor histidine kinase [Terracidiphilus sp.]|nr:HAMP domain-containing sensor histidine kinase [Terracidiphilus sp.]